MFSVQWFTEVEGGMGDNFRPINTRKGEEMNWGKRMTRGLWS